MNKLGKTTLTTLEVAEMMEVSHNDVLRKIEGRKDRKGYIQILAESQMAVGDYFIKSSYKDANNQDRLCYEVTKLGCDFMANKFTGEKGVIFTARYVKRFHDMENRIKQIPLTEQPGEVAKLINAVSRLMERQGSEPYKVTENARLLCEQYGIQVIEDFVKIPEYQQLKFLETANRELAVK